jgi:DNA polymerase V
LSPARQERREALLATIDALNARHGRGTIQWAACGLQAPWAMRRSRLSRSATTRLEEVPVVWT